MGVVYSYLYSEEVGQEKNGKRQCSDPSYTIQYPPQEADFLREVEEREEREEAHRQHGKMGPEMWEQMSPGEKKKLQKKSYNKKLRARKRANEKMEVIRQKRDELRPWLDQLSPLQRSYIKEVQISSPTDPDLLSYLSRPDANLVQCPNRFCAIFFEKMEQSKKGKAAAEITKADGTLLSGDLLVHFLDNRFRCHNCDTNFCLECQAIPYHLGESCAQYKARTAHPPCRVCGKAVPIPPDGAAKPESVCSDSECRDLVQNMCALQAKCKHPCNGAKGHPCFCLRSTCAQQYNLIQTGDDFCSICWTSGLASGTCITLKCGHVFHRHCIEQKLSHKWTGARISFNFANCPLCQKPIELTTTSDYNINVHLRAIQDLKKELRIKAMHFLKAEGMLADVSKPGHKYHGKPLDYAMDVFSFYMCHECKTPYYGGKRQCGDILNFDPEELVCGGCSGLLECEKHGKRYIHYKCRFCCQIASWFCFGMVHYCEECHNNPYEYWASNNTLISVPPPCPGKDKCPLGIDHPPNGFEEMSLGCSRCKLEELGIVMEDEPADNDDYDEDFLF